MQDKMEKEEEQEGKRSGLSETSSFSSFFILSVLHCLYEAVHSSLFQTQVYFPDATTLHYLPSPAVLSLLNGKLF